MNTDNNKELRKCYCGDDIKQFMALREGDVTQRQFKCNTCRKYYRVLESNLTGKEVWFDAGRYNQPGNTIPPPSQ